MTSEKTPEMIGINFECTSCQKNASEQKRVPISRVIEKLDDCFRTNDLASACRLLEHWSDEARTLGDISGELSIVNEMLGLYRKTNDKEKALDAVGRALTLIEANGADKTVSGATVMLNAATTKKAFGKAREALPLYEAALKIYRTELDEGDVLFAALYNNYATALVDLERYEEALSLYTLAASITSREVSSFLDCAVTYVNMAHLYESHLGFECERIEECLTRAKSLLEDGQIERNAYYAFVCEKCAPSFDYFGYFLYANELRERSRRIYEGA